uniref:Uncharacterized protein n=1 Tax=Rhizophora mucronata TaxID=61149 RepID=A0A2P2PC02_RHIMU
MHYQNIQEEKDARQSAYHQEGLYSKLVFAAE